MASKTKVPATDLATTDEIAKGRAAQWKGKDPFPNVEAALLNSADILAYIKATSLIHPFNIEDLKGASYDVVIQGDVIYYDDESKDNNKKKTVSLINDGDYFELRPNSIAFVTLQPTFRIPDYLALRFNLKIKHIYKGLLLGTGPLVDPGFNGKLSIPLHNLTSNTYRFYKGDSLITMEFTKMSMCSEWNKNVKDLGHNEKYIFNEFKEGRDVNVYIARALEKDGLNTVISSIPTALENSRNDVAAARESVENAEKVAKGVQKMVNFQSIASLFVVGTMVVSAITLTCTAVNKANDRYDKLMERYSQMEAEYSKQIENLTTQISNLEKELSSILGTDVIIDSIEKSADVQQEIK